MILAALLLTAVAIVFLRNQVRPIRALAEAAEAFGKGRSVPFRPAGAEEVRRAGAAFLSMRSRLERQIEQRTQMLSGVSHDLRTPLTRMKLTLALMDESEETRDLLQDIDQMERMLGEFLAFARGDSLEETVADRALRARRERRRGRPPRRRRGRAWSSDGAAVGGPTVPLRAGAVARALQNLVGNAARHGSRVLLTVRLSDKWLAFVVEDDGPGIPEADRARALQPFTRLDAARAPDRRRQRRPRPLHRHRRRAQPRRQPGPRRQRRSSAASAPPSASRDSPTTPLRHAVPAGDDAPPFHTGMLTWSSSRFPPTGGNKQRINARTCALLVAATAARPPIASTNGAA